MRLTVDFYSPFISTGSEIIYAPSVAELALKKTPKKPDVSSSSSCCEAKVISRLKHRVRTKSLNWENDFRFIVTIRVYFAVKSIYFSAWDDDDGGDDDASSICLTPRAIVIILTLVIFKVI